MGLKTLISSLSLFVPPHKLCEGQEGDLASVSNLVYNKVNNIAQFLSNKPKTTDSCNTIILSGIHSFHS